MTTHSHCAGTYEGDHVSPTIAITVMLWRSAVTVPSSTSKCASESHVAGHDARVASVNKRGLDQSTTRRTWSKSSYVCKGCLNSCRSIICSDSHRGGLRVAAVNGDWYIHEQRHSAIWFVHP
jgi:hypothetical protein